MHTVKLKINDDIYNHIMFFLKNLDNNKIKILPFYFLIWYNRLKNL